MKTLNVLLMSLLTLSVTACGQPLPQFQTQKELDKIAEKTAYTHSTPLGEAVDMATGTAMKLRMWKAENGAPDLDGVPVYGVNAQYRNSDGLLTSLFVEVSATAKLSEVKALAYKLCHVPESFWKHDIKPLSFEGRATGVRQVVLDENQPPMKDQFECKYFRDDQTNKSFILIKFNSQTTKE